MSEIKIRSFLRESVSATRLYRGVERMYKQSRLKSLRRELNRSEKLRQHYDRDYQYTISVHANMKNLEARRIMARSGLDFYTIAVNDLLKQIKELESELK